MWTQASAIIAFAAAIAASSAVAQAPLYDIRAELVYQAQSSLYAVQIRNVGPTIPDRCELNSICSSPPG